MGIGGGNLERDLKSLRGLCDRHGTGTSYIDALVDHNARRYDWVLSMLRQHIFARNPFPNLAVWGLTYKKNTSSIKNSPAVRLIKDVRGAANVRAWDPVVSAAEIDLPLPAVASKESALENADGLVIMTDWDEFADCDSQLFHLRMRAPVIVDCVGILESKFDRLAGVSYISTGRPPIDIH